MTSIITVADVYRAIDEYAPFETQDKFDNSGLLVGSMSSEVEGIEICLDITRQAVEEAAEKGAQLIVSHHPVIFNKLSSLENSNPVTLLAKYGINAICAHTNLDMAKGGISDIMLELLELGGETRVLEPVHSDGTGYGRIVELDFASDAAGLAQKCKSAFGCSVVRFYDSKNIIKTVGVCSGAGGSEDNVAHAAKMGCDALITGDVKHSGFIEAANRGISVIDAGHFHTENIVCGQLATMLERKFDIPIYVAESSVDIASYL